MTDQTLEQDAFQIYVTAYPLSDEERESYLTQACQNRPKLRARVEEFLFSADEAKVNPFLDTDVIVDLKHQVVEAIDTQNELQEILVGKKIGHIAIQSELDHGGMGQVFIGFDEKLQRKVAVKVTRHLPSFGRQTRARFLREAQILSQLDHPNICRIFEIIEDESQDFLVLEYIKGQHLRDAMSDKMSDGFKLKIAIQIIQALASTHALSIVHRDLKPENIMLTKHGEVKILDYGLARFDQAEVMPPEVEGQKDPDIAQNMTDRGNIMGTPRYMSPEQAQGKPVTPASDMYSFGLVLQELFSGKQPFSVAFATNLETRNLEMNRFDLLLRAARGETRPVQGLSNTLTQLITQLKSIDPANRPSAEQALHELQWIQNKPRRRVRQLVSAAFVAILLLGISISTIGFFRAKKAERAALHAQTLAERSEERADSIATFLKDMLAAPHPEELGLEVKVVDVVDQASQKIESSFQGDPLTRASILETLGQTYTGLGVYDRALEHFNNALKIRKENSEETDADRIRSMSQVGNALLKCGELQEAESQFRALMAFCHNTWGPESPQAIDASFGLAQALLNNGKYAESEELHQRVLEYRIHKLGEKHPDTCMAKDALGSLFFLTERFSEAEDIFRDVVNNYKQSNGDQKLDIMNSMSNYGISLSQNSKHDEAEIIFLDLLENQKEMLGEDHPNVIETMHRIGQSLFAQRKFHDAELMWRRVVQARARVLGASHPQTLQAESNLGAALHRLEKFEKARDVYERLIEKSRPVLGKNHPDTARIMNNLGGALYRLGDFEEAEKIYRETAAIRKAIYGGTHPAHIRSLGNIGNVLSKQNRNVEAEKILRQAMDLSGLHLGEDHQDTIRTMLNMALVLQANEKYREAETYFQRVIEVRQKTLGGEHPNTQRAQTNLATLYSEERKYHEAEHIFHAVYQSRRESLGGGHAKTQETMSDLATTMIHTEKFMEAEDLAGDLLRIRREHFGEEHEKTCDAMSILGHALLAQEKFEEAVEYLQKAADLGHPEAQFNLATMYEKGQGVSQNHELALHWYQKAAAQDHEKAKQALDID